MLCLSYAHTLSPNLDHTQRPNPGYTLSPDPATSLRPDSYLCERAGVAGFFFFSFSVLSAGVEVKERELSSTN